MDIYLYIDVFEVNKYCRWYQSIISKALCQDRTRQQGYFEAHHILPVSIFPEYKSEKSNIVFLTAKEHFVCHWLLTKFTKKDTHKMLKAVHKMTQNKTGKRIYSSIEYEIARKCNSSYMKQNNPTKSTKVRLKMSESAKKRKTSDQTRIILSKIMQNIGLVKKVQEKALNFITTG